jgi:N-acetylglutamate synthase-like GNAT family acetyltransferase
MEDSKIIYQVLRAEDLTPHFLQDFNRHQVTNRVWYEDNGNLVQKEDHFIDDWDEEKKAEIIQSLIKCVNDNGKVIGAYESGRLAGFANVEAKLFGARNEYAELPYIHVSNEKRGCGIGKKLFQMCCSEAQKLGARKLYIAAHPSIESQAFYKKAGCTLAEEINEAIFAKEPLDLQLEKNV